MSGNKNRKIESPWSENADSIIKMACLYRNYLAELGTCRGAFSSQSPFCVTVLAFWQFFIEISDSTSKNPTFYSPGQPPAAPQPPPAAGRPQPPAAVPRPPPGCPPATPGCLRPPSGCPLASMLISLIPHVSYAGPSCVHLRVSEIHIFKMGAAPAPWQQI